MANGDGRSGIAPIGACSVRNILRQAGPARVVVGEKNKRICIEKKMGGCRHIGCLDMNQLDLINPSHE
jgi:hypothetical protein